MCFFLIAHSLSVIYNPQIWLYEYVDAQSTRRTIDCRASIRVYHHASKMENRKWINWTMSQREKCVLVCWGIRLFHWLVQGVRSAIWPCLPINTLVGPININRSLNIFFFFRLKWHSRFFTAINYVQIIIEFTYYQVTKYSSDGRPLADCGS